MKKALVLMSSEVWSDLFYFGRMKGIFEKKYQKIGKLLAD